MVMGLLPGLVFIPVGGVIADRWNRRNVIVVGDLVRAALIGLVPWLWQLTRAPALLYGLLFAVGTVTALCFPSRSALVPNLVERAQLRLAISANSLTISTSQVLGTLAFGLVVALAGHETMVGLLGQSVANPGVSLVFALGCCALLGVAFLSSRIRLPAHAADADAPAASGEEKPTDWHHVADYWRALGDGIRFLLGTRAVRRPVLIFVFFQIMAGAYVVLIVTFVVEVLGRDEKELWIPMAGIGLGLACATVIAGKSGILSRVPHLTQLLFIGTGALMILVARSDSLIATVLLSFFQGCCGGVLLMVTSTRLQLVTPDKHRGRVISNKHTLDSAALIVGSALAGPAAVYMHVSRAMAVLGYCAIAGACVAIVLRMVDPTQRRLGQTTDLE
jgi:dTMP kinase